MMNYQLSMYASRFMVLTFRVHFELDETRNEAVIRPNDPEMYREMRGDEEMKGWGDEEVRRWGMRRWGDEVMRR